MDLEKALALAPIPEPAAPLPALYECAVITMDRAAITDGNSTRPVIVNWGASTCSVVYFYNREDQKLAAVHSSMATPKVLKALAHALRGDTMKPLEVYVAGGLPGEEGHAQVSRDEAAQLVKFLSEEISDVVIKHFDMFDKNKSQDHAMDARTGEFFYLKDKQDRKELTRNHIILLGLKRHPERKTLEENIDLVFNGTLPHHQKKPAPPPVGDHTAQERSDEEDQNLSP